jgi:hypothetical protein
VVGFVNYPRFPSEPDVLFERAKRLAGRLVPALNQRSALLVAPDRTEWVTIDPPGARAT